MKHLSLQFTVALLGATAFLGHSADIPKPADLRTQAMELLGVIPDKMPGSENDTPEKIALGKKLFFEKKLSANQTQSCNSCHAVDQGLGGVDNLSTSPGAFGTLGGRNSPTVLNAGFHIAQFWDGRSETLEDQAKGPILNPVEMAMPDPTIVIERLSGDAQYVKDFKTVFAKDSDPVNYDNVAAAISAFERTLVTHDRFDDFLKGDDTALTQAELKGLNEFLTVGCTTCHFGPLLGGNNFKKSGIINPYENESDKGRIEVTEDEFDLFVFKVPSLRNIAITQPYFHDGKVAKLDDAVKKMAWMQLGQELTDDQVASISTFLKALTDKERTGPKQSL